MSAIDLSAGTITSEEVPIMWSSFTKDEKKLFVFLLVMLGLGSLVLPYIDGRRKTEVFAARSQGVSETTDQSSKRVTGAKSGRQSPSSRDGLIDINVASEQELQRLPGIGAVRAAAIVAYRESHGPFRQVSDLARVHGIGKATLRGLDGYITAGGESADTTRTASGVPLLGFTPASSPPASPVITVPRQGDMARSSEVLDINAASVEELAQLDQIGEVLARRIVEYRNRNGRFRSVEELDKVQGIGKKRIELNRHRLVAK